MTVSLFAATSLFAADGKALYEKECAKCHGTDAKGETKMGKKLGAKDYSIAKTWVGMSAKTARPSARAHNCFIGVLRKTAQKVSRPVPV